MADNSTIEAVEKALKEPVFIGFDGRCPGPTNLRVRVCTEIDGKQPALIHHLY
jgi:hypothetical protein